MYLWYRQTGFFFFFFWLLQSSLISSHAVGQITREHRATGNANQKEKNNNYCQNKNVNIIIIIIRRLVRIIVNSSSVSYGTSYIPSTLVRCTSNALISKKGILHTTTPRVERNETNKLVSPGPSSFFDSLRFHSDWSNHRAFFLSLSLIAYTPGCSCTFPPCSEFRPASIHTTSYYTSYYLFEGASPATGFHSQLYFYFSFFYFFFLVLFLIRLRFFLFHI